MVFLIAHWMFGTVAPEEFGSFGKTVDQQFRMIIGDWAFDAGSMGLH